MRRPDVETFCEGGALLNSKNEIGIHVGRCGEAGGVGDGVAATMSRHWPFYHNLDVILGLLHSNWFRPTTNTTNLQIKSVTNSYCYLLHSSSTSSRLFIWSPAYWMDFWWRLIATITSHQQETLRGRLSILIIVQREERRWCDGNGWRDGQTGIGQALVIAEYDQFPFIVCRW